MCRNRQLIEERNRRIAQVYHELAPRLRNYSDVVTALSQMFFLSEFRIQAIIRDMVRKGTFVAGEPVTPMYEDCCVLLAARGDFPAYAEALTARGIPVYADARENLLDAPHIRPLIALLRVIDNPAQDIYLAAAMLGPMFGFFSLIMAR